MKTDNHNDWTDIFRESFPEEERPAAGGWEAVAGRMRRAAARRRAAVAAAALALPVAGGVFFLTPSNSTRESEIAVKDTPVVVAEVPDIVTDVPELVANVRELVADIPARPKPVRNTVPAEVTAPTEVTIPVITDRVADVQPSRNDTPAAPGTTPVVPRETKEPVVTANVDWNDSAFEDYPDAVTGKASGGRRLTIGLGAGTMAGGAPAATTMTSMANSMPTKSSSNNFWNNTSGVVFQHNYVHDFPRSLGLFASYGLTDRISLESGLDFTRLHSKLDGIHTVMHFAGIPLRVNVNLFSAGPMEVYAGAGGKAEKCLKATIGGMEYNEPKIQWSGSALLGAQARITRSAYLYLQPEFSYYFTKTRLASYRTENRFGLTVNAGLRFSFAKN